MKPERGSGFIFKPRTSRTASAWAAALALMAGWVPAAQADSLSAQRQKLAALQAEAAQNQNQMQADKQQVQSLQQSVAAYQTALASLQSAMQQNQAQIASTQHELATLQQTLTDTQQRLTDTQEQFETQLRAMYETGGIPYLEVLLGATSFDDFLNRLYAIATVAQSNRKLAQQLLDLRTQIAEQQKLRQATLAQLDKQQADLQATQRTYQTLLARKQSALQQAKTQVQQEQQRQAVLESQIHLTQAQMQAIEEQTRAIQQRMATQSGSMASRSGGVSLPGAGANATASQIIAYAEDFIGIPYAWGGTSPQTGFDCSGFTQYVFRHFGIGLGRTALDQFGEGMPVSMADLEPGDLVFFSTYAPGATHVGIYIGNGQMIDAQDEGVTIASIHNSYWAARYIGARRIL